MINELSVIVNKFEETVIEKHIKNEKVNRQLSVDTILTFFCLQTDFKRHAVVIMKLTFPEFREVKVDFPSACI